MLVLLLP